MGTGLNWAKTKLHEVTKQKIEHNCTKIFLHKDQFARGHKIARGDKIDSKIILHKGAILHELQFCKSDSFARRVNLAQNKLP